MNLSTTRATTVTLVDHRARRAPTGNSTDGCAMTIAAPRRAHQGRHLSAAAIARLRRILVTLVFLACAAAAALLGILLTAHLVKVFLLVTAIVLLWILVVSVVDFFRT